MALRTTINSMKTLLSGMEKDLNKTEKGNKAAAQRVRTHSIKFAKVAKLFRKESVAACKCKPARKTAKKAKKTTTRRSKKARR